MEEARTNHSSEISFEGLWGDILRKEQFPIRMLCECRLTPIMPVKLDAEGFVVCPTHGVRRYGWLSVPYNAVRGNFGRYSPAQYEAWLLTGEVPDYELQIHPAAQDTRFNDDPMKWVDKTRSKRRPLRGRSVDAI